MKRLLFAFALVALVSCQSHPNGTAWPLLIANAPKAADPVPLTEPTYDHINALLKEANQKVEEAVGAENYVFFPLSYYLTSAMTYLLFDEESVPEEEWSILGTKGNQATMNVVAELYNAVTVKTSPESNETTVIPSSILVDENGTEIPPQLAERMANELGCSYLGKTEDQKQFLSQWAKEVTNGHVSEAPECDGPVTMIGSFFFNLPYAIGLKKSADRPFNGEGAYPFMDASAETDYYYATESWEAFSYPLQNKDYRLRFIKPKQPATSALFSDFDFGECFSHKDAYRGGVAFCMPKIERSDTLDLKAVAKQQGLFQKGTYAISKGTFESGSLKQDASIMFTETAVTGYAFTKSQVIPQSMPEKEFVLDSAFMYQVTGPHDLVLAAGKIVSLD